MILMHSITPDSSQFVQNSKYFPLVLEGPVDNVMYISPYIIC